MIKSTAKISFTHKEKQENGSRYIDRALLQYTAKNHEWILNSDIKEYKNFHKYFTIKYVEYFGWQPDNNTLAFRIEAKEQRYGNATFSRYASNLVDAKYMLINEFGNFIKKIEISKDRVAEVKTIERYKASFRISKNHNARMYTWYLRTDLPYMSDYLNYFYVKSIMNRDGRMLHTAHWLHRRSDKGTSIENCTSVAEAKYIVIEKYNEFISFYKKQNYYER